MKKLSQSGFTIVETMIVVVLLVAAGIVGYYVWQSNKTNHTNKPTIASKTTTSTYQSPPVTVPTAPQINNSSDLINAIQVLNQTSVSSNNTDSNQLNTYTSSF